MSEHPDISIKLIQQASEKYSEATVLRAAIQLIPYVGGPLDTLIGGEGQKIQQRRIAHFVDELDKRLRMIEAPQHALADEELFDLMIATFELVVKTRSNDKRARFAQIVANEIAHAKEIDDAETAIRLVGELGDLHVQVLDFAIHAPFRPSLIDGLGAISITANKHFVVPDAINNPALVERFPNIPERMLRLICSELIAKGLLRDEGTRRLGAIGMEYFVATDLASWLFSWLKSD